ncbi:patatin-like phospholipase family protein [Thermodesulfobacteriota bacterium]
MQSNLIQVFTHLFGTLDPELFSDLESRMTPVHLSKGEFLYHQGDPGTGMHILLTGRLQVSIGVDDDATERVVAMVEPGKVVGEIALFTGRERAATLLAMRDSTLAFLTRQDFEMVIKRHPEAQLQVSKYIIERLLDAQSQRGADLHPIRTLAVVPLDSSCDSHGLARRLQIALLRFGSTALIDSLAMKTCIQESQSVQDQRMISLERHFDATEKSHDYLVLDTDYGLSEWTRKCVTYADVLVFVSRATSPLDEAVSLFLSVVQQAGKPCPSLDLVLVHAAYSVPPVNTQRWLNAIPVERHFHIPWAGDDGFDRLARYYSGNAVSLVLGGGGARRFAHIGVVRTLREAGIPIDAVCGTSIGAIISGGIAFGWDDTQMLDVFKEAFVDDRPTDDYTVPIMSLVQGEKMSRLLRRYFGDTLIEDLWTPYFAVSASLSENREYVHRRGLLWRALRASASLPAIFPPLIEESNLLVDGGILNNLPVGIMRATMRGPIIAVNLSAKDDVSYEEERLPTGWEYFKRRLFSPGDLKSVPTLHRVVLKSTMLGSRREAQAAKLQADLFLNPPTSGFDLLDWKSFHEICEVGYQYARERVAAWVAEHPEAVHRSSILDARLRRAQAGLTESPLLTS